jgi:hypothetical protein
MHRPDDGIASLAGGAFAAAAVTGGGELHLWGTLLTREGAAALLQKSGAWRLHRPACCRPALAAPACLPR